MIALRKQHPAFLTTDFLIDGANNLKQIHLYSPEGDICILANLDITEKEITPGITSTGKWKEHFTGETITGTLPPLTLAPGEYKVYIRQ